VAFAGLVAGRLVVTINHPDGLRSSYVGLAGTELAKSDVVAGGALVGWAGGPFHLGVRRGDRYLDPASLWGQLVGGGRVRLVPDREGPGASESRGGAVVAPGRPPPA
jgi:hypothetical protein